MKGNAKGSVLIVDDEPNALKVLSAILSHEGYRVFPSSDVDTAIRKIHKEDVDAVITDLKMPGKDGTALFQYVTENHPDVPVIFLTAYGTVESAVHSITRGAYYYFIKPPDYLKLKSILARAVEQRCLKRELASLKRRLSEGDRQSHVIGTSTGMQKVFETIDAVKDSESSVLVCGETGTGKELIARALHYGSTKKDMPFIAVNCAAIPKDLMESELFGYEKGAFTGATASRVGKFEEAGSGTVFLDEIGELALPLQAKLLRVLQEREVERLGSNKKINVKFRLLSSTNRDLKKEVEAGNFREDLFYRINVVQINVPPLRERRDDIPLLVSEFVKDFCVREKKSLTVSDEAMRVLQNHQWPGNVRQLRNTVERAVVLAKGKSITTRELPDEFHVRSKGPVATERLRTLRELEVQTIRDALRECKGNKSKTARLLGISRKAFYKRLSDFGIASSPDT